MSDQPSGTKPYSELKTITHSGVNLFALTVIVSFKTFEDGKLPVVTRGVASVQLFQKKSTAAKRSEKNTVNLTVEELMAAGPPAALYLARDVPRQSQAKSVGTTKRVKLLQ